MRLPGRKVMVSVAASALLAAACSSSGSKTAATGPTTAPGISATQITVGNVSTLGGPVPGLFQGAPFGVDADVSPKNV